MAKQCQIGSKLFIKHEYEVIPVSGILNDTINFSHSGVKGQVTAQDQNSGTMQIDRETQGDSNFDRLCYPLIS